MISVVIPAYNEEHTLPLCLQSLCEQATSLPFEVIVVDNASTDGTVRQAKKFAKKLRLRIIPESTKGRSPARRTGFAAASGDTILSTDADTVVPPDWVDNLIRTLDNGHFSAATGPCRVTDLRPGQNLVLSLFQPTVMICWRLAAGHYWLNGFNFAIRRDIYLRSGGFNPRLNSLEDVDLSLRVSRIAKIKFTPRIRVVFSGRRFRRGLAVGLFAYVRSFIDIYIRKKPNSILPDVR